MSSTYREMALASNPDEHYQQIIRCIEEIQRL
jgi:hypothetical protein